VLAIIPSFLANLISTVRILLQVKPRRRELDYLRYLGASDETAKEVKIFVIGFYHWSF
jgi:ATP-binding cassette subfamily B protein